jgi:hypothetical protein
MVRWAKEVMHTDKRLKAYEIAGRCFVSQVYFATEETFASLTKLRTFCGRTSKVPMSRRSSVGEISDTHRPIGTHLPGQKTSYLPPDQQFSNDNSRDQLSLVHDFPASLRPRRKVDESVRTA